MVLAAVLFSFLQDTQANPFRINAREAIEAGILEVRATGDGMRVEVVAHVPGIYHFPRGMTFHPRGGRQMQPQIVLVDQTLAVSSDAVQVAACEAGVVNGTASVGESTGIGTVCGDPNIPAGDEGAPADVGDTTEAVGQVAEAVGHVASEQYDELMGAVTSDPVLSGAGDPGLIVNTICQWAFYDTAREFGGVDMGPITEQTVIDAMSAQAEESLGRQLDELEAAAIEAVGSRVFTQSQTISEAAKDILRNP